MSILALITLVLVALSAAALVRLWQRDGGLFYPLGLAAHIVVGATAVGWDYFGDAPDGGMLILAGVALAALLAFSAKLFSDGDDKSTRRWR